MPAEKQHKITGRLCHYIVKSLRPFSIVEDTYFRAFLSELNTSYKVPSRGEVSERFLPKMYEAALLNLKTELQEVEYAALTGDGWTSRVADHYLTLTVHYTKDWEMKVRVLQKPTKVEGRSFPDRGQHRGRDWTVFGRLQPQGQK
ncbi:hypothetical protein CgunFtcFv8_005357 [Champsocephalus gunnari]|uniref:Uncharacterized protein n=1 Tax=Champsocephalus gunnari TaxID=52237 RepID=A0AAN8CVE4_CHAGU|nr:hypothetical protein CgunFtcFv8_005357 [Champsocephalus gunnari]